jgi:hypothetical protein
MLDRQSGRPPFGESLQQSSCSALTASQEFDRAIRVHAVRPTTIGDVLLVLRQFPKTPLQAIHRYRECAGNMTGLEFAQRPCVEHNDIARSSSLKKFLERNRFGVCPVTELHMHETLEVSKPASGDSLNRRAQLEHRRIGKAVIHEESLLPAFDQGRLLERLKVLRGVGDGESGLGSERINGALGLGEKFQEFQSVWIAERLADSGELAVETIFEVAVSGHAQVINRSLEQ